ncbi:hypothetical protein ACH5RR_015571 [Cinchona calisaya]|uniref:Uncharacterized protein n=1 Tax=Cinchona calisaya TaxID=153742 RepID=A0ABD2ZX49_9GENT
MITKYLNKEIKVIPTQNSKGNLTEREVNAPNEEQPSKFDDHDQSVDLVGNTLEEMEASVTGPSKFDVFSNGVHTFLNVNLTKNLEEGGNDAANSQARTQI